MRCSAAWMTWPGEPVLGAVGWVSGLVNAFPNETGWCWDLFTSGRYDEAAESTVVHAPAAPRHAHQISPIQSSSRWPNVASEQKPSGPPGYRWSMQNVSRSGGDRQALATRPQVS